MSSRPKIGTPAWTSGRGSRDESRARPGTLLTKRGGVRHGDSDPWGRLQRRAEAVKRRPFVCGSWPPADEFRRVARSSADHDPLVPWNGLHARRFPRHPHGVRPPPWAAQVLLALRALRHPPSRAAPRGVSPPLRPAWQRAVRDLGPIAVSDASTAAER